MLQVLKTVRHFILILVCFRKHLKIAANPRRWVIDHPIVFAFEGNFFRQFRLGQGFSDNSGRR